MAEVVPVTRAEARAFIRLHHRHNPRPPAAEVLRAGLADHRGTVAVALAGRPLARAYCDGRTLEVTRVAVSPDVFNGCSQLYGALWRAAKALGYRRLVTYTRQDEGGASLRAAGWTLDAELPAREHGWDNRAGRAAPGAPVARLRWVIESGRAVG